MKKNAKEGSEKSKKDEYFEKLAEYAKIYAEIAKDNPIKPTRAEINRHVLLPTRVQIDELERIARENHPECFFDAVLSEKKLKISNQQAFLAAKTSKRFIISTVVEGCPVNEEFLGAIRQYCKYNKAELLLLTCRDPASRVITKTGRLIDKAVLNDTFVTKELFLNKNISIQTIKTSPKQIKPTTGLDRIGQRRGTFIFASSKLVQNLVPVFGEEDLPHAMLATGALTLPRYETDKYMSERTAYIANFDHEFGAVIVDVEDENIYHFSLVKAEPDGSFFHQSIHYRHDRTPKKVQAEALIFGDWHSGATSKTARECFFDLAEHSQPKAIFVHDSFDGATINPHEMHLQINMVKKARKGKLSLSEELDVYTRDILDISRLAGKWGGKVYIVYSNHDDFIARNIQAENPLQDPYNAEEKLLMAMDMLKSKNPLEGAFRRRAGQEGGNVVFLTLDSSVRVSGFECAIHGHIGPKGRKCPGLDELSKSYGQIISAHLHSPAKSKMAYRVGTMSNYKLGYNKGASDWLHTSALVNPGSTCQLINSIYGRWRLPKNLTSKSKTAKTKK